MFTNLWFTLSTALSSLALISPTIQPNNCTDTVEAIVDYQIDTFQAGAQVVTKQQPRSRS